jgi:periplasmic divalent cation tolerance protein
MTEFVTVTTTTDTAEEAQRLSASAVEARLAACGQVSAPIASTYWWEGKIETASEYLIEFKTRADIADRLTDHLKANHSYDTPEVVITPIMGGNPAYLAWIETETEG